MKKSDGFSIFYQAPNWPRIPPWWALTSPQVAALLNITPETLHIKRALGTAPQAISAAMIKPAQGQPTFFRLAYVLNWLALKMGVNYSITDQVMNFVFDFFPEWQTSQFPLAEQVKHFDWLFKQENKRFLRGEPLENFDEHLILVWGDYFAKQPKFIAKNMQYFDLQYDLLATDSSPGQFRPMTENVAPPTPTPHNLASSLDHHRPMRDIPQN